MNILNKLTIKHLKMNKRRTIVTIVGIILSTALMVGIGTLFSSFREYAVEETIASSGKQHITIKDVKYDKYNYVKENLYVKDTYLSRNMGYSKYEGLQNEYKPYLFLKEGNDSYIKSTTLIKGEYPKNDKEIVISNHIKSNGGLSLKIGDKITLNLGNRIGSLGLKDEYGNDIISEPEELNQSNSYTQEEILNVKEQREFKIVGIIKRMHDEPYNAPGYTILTKIDESKISNDALTDISVIYKNVKNIKEKSENIYKNIKSDDYKKNKIYDIDYNNSLLSLYGQSEYKNINSTIMGTIAIILFLIMIGCAVVIYNSFSISVMERKKQFGLFSSIGATKTQLKKTVFFEAFIVGIIGIPIGILSGIGGIWVVLKIVNSLLNGMIGYKLTLSLYPMFIIVPIIYMIITIIISAFLPARQASKISPIEAIRLNDDIKIKNKKIKTNKFIKKIFGVEGDLALKNTKRNKKKYRITILSLFISIVLFISFSTFLEYGTKSSQDFFDIKNYDVAVNIYSDNNEIVKKNLEQIKELEKVDHYVISNQLYGRLNLSKDKFTKAANDYIKKQNIEEAIFGEKGSVTSPIISLDQKSYEKYIKGLGLNIKDYKGHVFKPIVVNYTQYMDYNQKKVLSFKPLNMKTNDQIKISFSEERENDLNPYILETNIYVTNKIPDELNYYIQYVNIPMIVSEDMFKALESTLIAKEKLTNKIETSVYIQAKDHKGVTKQIQNILDSSDQPEDYSSVANITESMEMQRNVVIVMGIFLYGFISLVTLIGVTSVFNTINTSIALRRKEFAVLRSIGLTPKGFNKMLRFESLIYGLKALLYSLPVSFGIIYLFSLSFSGIASYTSILIPWKAIFIAIISVFIIVFVTMMYATRKIKKENILDAIREENI